MRYRGRRRWRCHGQPFPPPLAPGRNPPRLHPAGTLRCGVCAPVPARDALVLPAHVGMSASFSLRAIGTLSAIIVAIIVVFLPVSPSLSSPFPLSPPLLHARTLTLSFCRTDRPRVDNAAACSLSAPESSPDHARERPEHWRSPTAIPCPPLKNPSARQLHASLGRMGLLQHAQPPRRRGRRALSAHAECIDICVSFPPLTLTNPYIFLKVLTSSYLIIPSSSVLRTWCVQMSTFRVLRFLTIT
ncbi:hypothetical protein B0H13DRAFT_142275 [Mycena leptocephala]|nr:hypothetical protein B0H13DRAFT_142275 [Mycena leptocephala]